MPKLAFDPTRAPTIAEQEQLRRRLLRLQVPGLSAHVDALDTKLLDYERPGGQTSNPRAPSAPTVCIPGQPGRL